MGGDRTCPDNCLLQKWWSLPEAKRTAQARKPLSEQLYKQGYTMEAIATQLGVTHKTISLDLKEICTSGTNSNPVKSATNPKGAGRPKGSKQRKPSKPRKRQTDEAEQTIVALAQEGKSSREIADEVGVEGRAVRHVMERENIKRKAEAIIDPATLSITAQQKLDIAIRQHKKRMDIEFEQRVLAECKERLDSISLPHYAKELEGLERMISSRKGVMDKTTYNKIRWCLHSDHVQDATMKRRYDDAFAIFNNLEKLLLSEKDSPTAFRPLPRTYEELMAMRAKVQAERRAKRNSKASVSVR
jgi:IS30 family transposase